VPLHVEFGARRATGAGPPTRRSSCSGPIGETVNVTARLQEMAERKMVVIAESNSGSGYALADWQQQAKAQSDPPLTS
jgi:class 3 adenylate cyclase